MNLKGKFNQTGSGSLVWIVIIVIIVVIVLVWYANSSKQKVGHQPEPTPASEITSRVVDEDADEIVDENREVSKFDDRLPAGFPVDFPVDPDPVQITQSTVERSQERDETTQGHTQLTYAYVTEDQGSEVFQEIKDYMTRKGYIIEEEQTESFFSLFGMRDEFYVVNVSIARNEDNMSLVTVSIVDSDPLN